MLLYASSIHHFCHFSSGNSVLHETKWQLLSPRGDQKRVKHETNQWPSLGMGQNRYLVNPKIAGKWMFIPLKCIYRYWPTPFVMLCLSPFFWVVSYPFETDHYNDVNPNCFGCLLNAGTPEACFTSVANFFGFTELRLWYNDPMFLNPTFAYYN